MDTCLNAHLDYHERTLHFVIPNIRLLDPKSAVLTTLGGLFPFETCIGMNGRVWVKADTAQNTVIAVTAIRNSEFIHNDKELRAMVRGLYKSVIENASL
jgi:exosome complex RNA-binding protein Rrp4